MYKSQKSRFNLLAGKQIMSIDYGEKYTGLALFTPARDPFPLCHDRIPFKNQKQLLCDIKTHAGNESVNILVLGIPRLLDGKETKSTHKISTFGYQLKNVLPHLQIYFQDETLSTFDAKERMKNSPEFNFKVSMEKIDMVSAVIILEDFIAHRAPLKEVVLP